MRTLRLRAPKLVWLNELRFSEEDASANSYCIRQSYESTEIYEDENRIQFADRYGGVGVGSAGGSGRCASLDNLQIKGVGVTPLVTRDVDPHHTTGTMSLHEASREVIWSALYSVALPYGAVAPLAIVLTGGVFLERNPEGIDIPRQRTLLMREFALRPAHYLRNLYFRETVQPIVAVDGLCADARRTQLAIRGLSVEFERAFGTDVVRASGIEKVNLGLRTMARRFAAQAAGSFAKRIFHGSINCSNIALDGRFLDFGVTTFVESYRRRAWWAYGWRDQWTQFGGLVRTLRLFYFQVRKYLGAVDGGRLIEEADLASEFQAALNDRLEIEMLRMTGVPEDAVMTYPRRERQRLSRVMREIYSRGANERFTTWPADMDTAGSNPPPRQNGRFDLNEILAIAGSCLERDNLDRSLTGALSDAKLRCEFIERYNAFLAHFVSGFYVSERSSARIYIALQAIRLNADLSFLKRECLDTKLTPLDLNPEGIGAVINDTIREGTYFVQSVHPDIIGVDTSTQVKELARMHEALSEFVTKCAAVKNIPVPARDGLKGSFEK